MAMLKREGKNENRKKTYTNVSGPNEEVAD
jgi:hypothetical protein